MHAVTSPGASQHCHAEIDCCAKKRVLGPSHVHISCRLSTARLMLDWHHWTDFTLLPLAEPEETVPPGHGPLNLAAGVPILLTLR